ncbi:hypothetical protein [Pseudoduganella violaceinigra]|uniref:hypothetical protein n=1 Tax=Pseudoduganella violaceinigra TaxID=246602 RepID=UPI0004865BD8|nr:hypothetical protein [Pseudoduganella violaceinigra]
MKKKIAAITFCLLAIATHLYYVFRTVEGVRVYETVLGTQSIIEQYRYHRALKSLVAELDIDALKYLLSADCGGAAGCYDHGTTLVEVLLKAGDRPFSALVFKLDKQESELLYSYFDAGYEYGGFTDSPDWTTFKKHFPLTFEALGKRSDGARVGSAETPESDR